MRPSPVRLFFGHICYREHYVPRYGFTLLELLVVVTVIALLVTLLLPVVKVVRDRAREIRCLANTRQLGLAFMAYGADNSGAIPQAWVTTNAKLNWCVSTEPYLDGLTFRRAYATRTSRRPFGCTNVVLGRQLADGSWNFGDGNGYGINVWPAWDEPGGSKYVAGADNPGAGLYYRTFRLAQITKHARRVWAGDCNSDDYGRDYSRVDASTWRIHPASGAPAEASLVTLNTPSGNTFTAQIGQRHRSGGRTNQLFFDGHSQSVPLQQLLYGLFNTARVE